MRKHLQVKSLWVSKRLSRKIFTVITSALFLISLSPAIAATYTVTNTLDAGPGSLREAITTAELDAAADVIDLTGVTGTITLATELPYIGYGLTITGPGASLLTISGGNAVGVFTIYGSSDYTVNITGLTIADGASFQGAGINLPTLFPFQVGVYVTACIFSNNHASTIGGAIFSSNRLSVTNCTFLNNAAAGNDGGGICSSGQPLVVTGCTFSGNSAFLKGGGILCMSGAITNCTFSGNSALVHGGGIYNAAGTLTITNCTVSGNNSGSGGGVGNGNTNIQIGNSIIAGNTAATSPDVFTSGGYPATSQGYNFIGKGDGSVGFTNGVNNDQVGSIASPINPLLGVLANNGGLTSTMELLSGSPCINTGSCINATDQRGIAKPQSGLCDIGAFELAPCTLFLNNRIYVNASATGANNGSSWTDAYTDLQSALKNSCTSVTQIWVAAGNYKPTSGTNRSISFVMKADVAIYGGFNGTETLLSQRNWTTNVTILSGDIGTPGDNSDNSYHVIFNNNNGLTNTAILDGFTISGGNANGGNLDDSRGGGMYNYGVSISLINCSFSGNTAVNGGGLSNYLCVVGQTVTNCTFSGNSATQNGGGMQNFISRPTMLKNVVFVNNSAGFIGGGFADIDNSNSGATLTNVAFLNNSAQYGGAIGNLSSRTILINSTIANNYATNEGGGIHFSDALPGARTILTNCIVWGNKNGANAISSANPTLLYGFTVSNSDIELSSGVATGTGNLNVDPLFVSATNLHLQACSPAIDAGTATGAPATDFDGDARPHGSGVDMGYDEYIGGPCCPLNNTITVNNLGDEPDANPGDGICATSGGFITLRAAIMEANALPACSPMTINFSVTGIIDLATALPNINHPDLTITGPGISLLTLRRSLAGGTPNFSMFIVNSGKNFSISGMKVTNGYAPFSGGAIFNNGGTTTINACDFLSNFSVRDGGALTNQNGTMNISNSAISNNTATTYAGGLLNVSNGAATNATLTNCVISGNTAPEGSTAGGVANYGQNGASNVNLVNCTVTLNSGPGAGSFGGLANFNFGAATSMTLKNTINAGNTGIQAGGNVAITSLGNNLSSDATGGTAASDMVNTDPLFISPSNFHLQPCSPAIDAGTAIGAPATDIDGNTRVDAIIGGGIVDIGAYEYQSALSGGSRWYVNAANATPGNGTSWACAFKDLQKALAVAAAGNEIWVAAGTYKPTSGTDRTISFIMKNGVAIYAGFNGTETLLSQRNWATNLTILSGDLLGNDGLNFTNNADNSIHVIFNNNNGITSTAILDGFTVSGGNANGTFSNSTGGGMYNYLVSPTINHCVFKSNNAGFGGGALYNIASNMTFEYCDFTNNHAGWGGAISNYANAGQTANLTFDNCNFSGNISTGGGGAINHGYYNSVGTGLFKCTNCKFINNSSFDGSTIGGGGAFFNEAVGFDGEFENCLFDGNTGLGTADWGGGAFLIYQGNATITNSTIVNSISATEGGAISIYSSSSTVIVKNSILWNNQAVTGNSIYNGQGGIATIQNSLIQDAACPVDVICGAGMIYNEDPLFVGLADQHLQACSPAIDAGNDAASTLTTDLDGNTRKFEAISGGNLIDMGAYEYQTVLSSGNRWYVNAAVSSPGNGTSWACAFKDLQLATASSDAGDEIWVAAGTYKPTSGTDRNISFSMKDNVAIYGGFPNTGNPTMPDRDWVAHLTTLSGDIDGVADVVTGSGKTLAITNNGGNSLHVIFNHSGLSSTALLDGFTISGGNANISSSDINQRAGGGMLNDGTAAGNFCNPTIRNCIFTHNSANYGGGLANRGNAGNCSPQISNCNFLANYSTSYGGGIFQGGVGNTSYTDCNFDLNFALDGGAIALTTSYDVNPTTISLLRCNFSGNYASSQGGAIQSGFSFETGNRSLSLTNCSFIDNSCSGGAGAFGNGLQYTAGTTPVLFTNCLFKNNISHNGSNIGSGGAFQSTGSLTSQIATFINCVLDGNKALGTADDGGGAMMIYSGTVNLMNTTIANSQSASRGGVISIYNNTGAANINNSILWNNTAVTGNTIYNGSGGSATIQNSLIQDASCPANVSCGSGMIYNQDPSFVDLVGGDLHIQPYSLAVNAGTNAGAPATDYDGAIRLLTVANAADMGAFENQNPCRNPGSAGTISAGQSGCTPFNPVAITVTLPTGEVGTLEYKWQSSTDNSVFADITTGFFTAASYDPGPLTVTTWYKRLTKVSCETNWLASDAVEMTVHPLPIVGFGGVFENQDLCGNPIALIGGSPLGGTYSGTGVSNGMFDPSQTGTGTFTLTYTYTDGFGCTNSATNSIVVNEPYATTYFIGIGGDFPDLTGDNGLFAFLNSHRRCGDVTAIILNDLTENGNNPLNQSIEVLPGGYTTNILPVDATPKTISGASSQALIRLNGIDRITIDGGLFWPYRALKFRNNNPSAPTLSIENETRNLSIAGCEIEGNNSNASSGVVVLDASGASNSSLSFNRNIIGNIAGSGAAPANLFLAMGAGGNLNSTINLNLNEFRDFSSNAIYAKSTGNGNNWIISNNSIYATLSYSSNQTAINFIPGSAATSVAINSNYIGGSTYQTFGSNFVNSGNGFFKGISVNCGNSTISNNSVANIKLSGVGAPAFTGIEILGGTATVDQGNFIGSSSIIYSISMAGAGTFDGIRSASISVVTIRGNTIGNINFSGNAGSPKATAIYLKRGNADRNKVVSIGSQTSTLTPWIYGIVNEASNAANSITNNMIALKGGNSSNPRLFGIYDKSVTNGGSVLHNTVSIQGAAFAAATNLSSAFYREGSAAIILYNNILHNAKTSSAAAKHYAIYSTSTATLTTNFNDLVSVSPNLVYWGGTTFINLGAWKNLTRDYNSISVTPVYLSPTDLHLTVVNSGINNKGTGVKSKTYDFDGAPRSASTPDIGCDEFVGAPAFTEPEIITEQNLEPSLAIYPNPMNNNGILSITLAEQSNVNLMIYNITGEIVYTQKEQNMQAGTTNIAFNTINLPAGIYMCRMLVNGKKLLVKRMEVIR